VDCSAYRIPAADISQFIFNAFYHSQIPYKLTNPQTHQLLQSIEALIVIDNSCLNSNELKELMDLLPQSVFLLTSKNRQLEHLGESIILRGLPQNAALALIARELGRQLTPEERINAEQICEVLHGHPHNILRAMGRVKVDGLSLAEVIREIQGEQPNKSLFRKILISLDKPERQVLALLFVFSDIALSIEQLQTITRQPRIKAILKSLSQRYLLQTHYPEYGLSSDLVEILKNLQDSLDLTELLRNTYQWSQVLGQAPDPLIQERALAVSAKQVQNKPQKVENLEPLHEYDELNSLVLKQQNILLRLLEWAYEEKKMVPCTDIS
jgi:hypothetical protein